MSRVADFARDVGAMQALAARVETLLSDLPAHVRIADARQMGEWFRLRDMLMTAGEVLCAMIYSAREIGSHGAAYVVGDERTAPDAPRATRTLTCGGVARVEPVVPIPDAELWFETLLARKVFD